VEEEEEEGERGPAARASDAMPLSLP
jgi:hypothetical protein